MGKHCEGLWNSTHTVCCKYYDNFPKFKLRPAFAHLKYINPS